jgi:hypothetical protein
MQRLPTVAATLLLPLAAAVEQPVEPSESDGIGNYHPHRSVVLQRRDEVMIPVWLDVNAAREGIALLRAGKQELVDQRLACRVPGSTAAIEIGSFGLLGRWREIVVTDERHRGCRGIVQSRFMVPEQ